MKDQSCPKRARLVERLAKAINKRKRMSSETASKQEQAVADQELQQAMDAVRANPAKDLCGEKSEKDRSAA